MYIPALDRMNICVRTLRVKKKREKNLPHLTGNIHGCLRGKRDYQEVGRGAGKGWQGGVVVLLRQERLSPPARVS